MKAIEGIVRTWPERIVTQTGDDLPHSKIRWAKLVCGHYVFRKRKPKLGSLIVCEKCSKVLSTSGIPRKW